MSGWIPPGYLALAKEGMSDSLRAVVGRWGLSDRFVLRTFLTHGRRFILRADAILAIYEAKLL
jgi:hypothetical protein